MTPCARTGWISSSSSATRWGGEGRGREGEGGEERGREERVGKGRGGVGVDDSGFSQRRTELREMVCMLAQECSHSRKVEVCVFLLSCSIQVCVFRCLFIMLPLSL